MKIRPHGFFSEQDMHLLLTLRFLLSVEIIIIYLTSHDILLYPYLAGRNLFAPSVHQI